jgi:hypothetical protein
LAEPTQEASQPCSAAPHHNTMIHPLAQSEGNMDKITRIGPPEAINVADGIYSFVSRLNETPAGHWIYAFKMARPVTRDVDPERVVVDPQQGLLFESEESLVLSWINHIDLWIAAANKQVADDEATEEKRRAEAQARDQRDLLLRQMNDKIKRV